MKRSAWMVGLLLCLPAAAQTNFFPRGDVSPVGPNDADLNRNFVRGEAGVDDLHCDEQGETVEPTSGLPFEDLDGAVDSPLADEAQVYVDQDVPGNDDAVCGTPSDPCSSVEWALSQRKGNAQAQGADNVFACVRGTRSSTVIDTADTDWDGEPGTVTLVAATRSNSGQRYDFEFATNPTVISSWDQDDDNEYPPYDTDDTAFRIDHGENHFTCTSASQCASRWEVMGLTSRGAGEDSSEAGFFYDSASGKPAGRGEHISFHGNHIYEVNNLSCQYSGKMVISFFSNDDHMFHFARNDVTFGGGYYLRGGGEQEGLLSEQNRVRGYAIGGNELNTDFNGLTCCSNATDPGCTNTSNVGGSETTGGNMGRLWCPLASGRENWDIVDNFFGIDYSKGGGDGYINGTGPTLTSQISGGIFLSGCKGVNLAGNYGHNLDSFPFAIVAYDDGISIVKSPEDWYVNDNTVYHDRSDSVPSGLVFGLAGINQQGTSGANITRQTVLGDWQFNNNCADLDIVTEDLDEGLLLLGPSALDLTAVDMTINGNAMTANWGGDRGVVWIAPNASCGTDCLPATFSFDGNVFADNVGDSNHYMVKAVQADWSGLCSGGSCDNNTYYGDRFQNDGTEYSTLAAWQGQWGEASSIANDNSAHPGCFLPTDGTDYRTGSSPPPVSGLSFFLRTN